MDGGGADKQLGPWAGEVPELPGQLYCLGRTLSSAAGGVSEASGGRTQIHARMPGHKSHSMSNPSSVLSDFRGDGVCSGPPVPVAMHQLTPDIPHFLHGFPAAASENSLRKVG